MGAEGREVGHHTRPVLELKVIGLGYKMPWWHLETSNISNKLVNLIKKKSEMYNILRGALYTSVCSRYLTIN